MTKTPEVIVDRMDEPLLSSTSHVMTETSNDQDLSEKRTDAFWGWCRRDRSRTPPLKKANLWSKLKSIITLLRPWEISLLVIVGIFNVFLTRMLGYIPGDFYYCLTNSDKQHFVKVIIKQCILVVIATVTFGSMDTLAEFSSLRWRKRLTIKVHDLYSHQKKYYMLEEDDIDNPDQRIQRDIDFLTTSLSNVVRKISATPFTIIYFTYLCLQYLNFELMLVLYLYFFLIILVQKAMVSPITPIVVKKEAAEANFRSSHIRMKGQAEAIALFGSEERERGLLDGELHNVLYYQRKLVFYRWFLSLSSTLIDYLGSIVMYSLLAFAIFTKIDDWGNVDKSELPRMISNAAFVVLQLTYSFSTISDTAKEVSSLFGYVERVGELLEYLLHGSNNLENCQDSTAGNKDGKGSNKGGILTGPHTRKLKDRLFEYSVHEPDVNCKRVIASVHPDLNELDGILAVPTFQFASLGVDFAPQSGCSIDTISAEMNKLHLNFLSFEGEVRYQLKKKGYFCDSIDPLTGCAMHTRRGERYSEAEGAKHFLKYTIEEHQDCPIVIHPRFGSSSYPATVFTNAPLPILTACIEDVLNLLPSESETEFDQRALVKLENVTILSKKNQIIVSDLTVHIKEKESLYVLGSSGSGKTDFVRALCGLSSTYEGNICIPDKKEIIVLPQTPLMLKDSTIAEQIAYPSSNLPSQEQVRNVLYLVGLHDLRPFTESINKLSKADIWKICIARVLHHKPRLVIIDEVPNAVSAESQKILYKRLKEYGVCYISTGTNVALGQYHTHTINLNTGQVSMDIVE